MIRSQHRTKLFPYTTLFRSGIVEYTDNILKENIPKIQWVSEEDLVKYTILKPNKLFIGDSFNHNSLQVIEGFAESFVDRKSTRLNSSHLVISYAVFCLKKKI